MAHSARVLIANGNLQTLNGVSECMRRNSFANLLETTGQKAISRAQGERPDVIFLGLKYNDRDTGDVVAELRSDVATRDIPLFLACGENEAPDWSKSWIARLDGVVTWPFDDAQMQAHMRAGLRLGTMRGELTRRGETLRRFGEESGDKWRAEISQGSPHVLLVRSENGCGDETEEALKGFASLETISLGGNIATALNGSETELVLIAADANVDATLDMCDDIRRNPALFHMPILVIYSGDADHAGRLYRNGATEVVALPLDAAELRARITMGVKQHRLRGYMLNAYRACGRDSLSDTVTGLFGAEFFRAHLQTLIDDTFRWDKNLSLNIVSVPEIDQLRTEYGNAAADHLASQLGGMISRLVRGEDLCARLDGSTFGVALPESPLEATSPTIQRMMGVLRFTEFSLMEVAKPVIVQPRIGSVEFRPGDAADDMIERATSAALAVNAA